MINRLLSKLTRKKYIGPDGDVISTYYSGYYWISIGPGNLIYKFSSKVALKETLEINGYKPYRTKNK